MSNTVMANRKLKAELLPGSEEELCHFIRKRTGIVIADHQLPTLRETVDKCCQHFSYKTAADYMRVLKNQDGEDSMELEYLIRGITIGESYFFRDQSQCSFLKDDLLPAMIERKRQAHDKTIRIWSAGCAAGQELYTIAIYLNELLPDIGEWNIHLLGTDINTEILQIADSGKYTRWSLRATPDDVVSKYFTVRDKQYTIKPALRQLTKFAYLNLFSDSFPSILTETSALDLILCRNVFIYFDTASINQVMDKFIECLTPEGVILLGASDNYMASNDSLLHRQGNKAFYYQRKKWCDEAVVHKPVAVVKKQSRNYEPVKLEPTTPASADLEAVTPVESKIGKYGIQEQKLQHAVDNVIELVRLGQWCNVIAAVDDAISQHGDNAALFQLSAKAHANLGEIDKALLCCERSLELNSTDPHTYLLFAIVLIEQNDLSEAEKVLRKALFLDNALVEAHFHLGSLYFRLGQKKNGLRSLHNALTMTEKKDPEKKIHNAHDMNYARFAEILRNEIDMHESHEVTEHKR